MTVNSASTETIHNPRRTIGGQTKNQPVLIVPQPSNTSAAVAGVADRSRLRNRGTGPGATFVVKRQVNVMLNYRPDYMWNRGGRAKELRIR